jgi:linoleoyl-CoA desaturase
MKISFKKNSREFHTAVTLAVNNYFESNNIDKKASGYMWFKTAFFASMVLLSYFGILFGGFPLPIFLLLWIMLGLSSVFLVVNCGHDAVHGAYSNKNWVNAMMSKSFDFLGANSYIWSITHNVMHHTYTNIEGADEDVDSIPFARVVPNQESKPYHRFQHIYLFLLYTMGTLMWVLVKDYKKFAQKDLGIFKDKKHPTSQYIKLFFFKSLYYTLFIVVPILVVDFAWYWVLIGFLIGHMAEGFAIATIFMLAHLVENVEVLAPDEQGEMEYNWAIHQMRTTANFGRNSKLTGFLTGGLNYQIEHHLFPTISHVHYPAISDIVKKTAEEHGVPYHEHPSFWAALKSHYRLLKHLGTGADLLQGRPIAA